MVINNATPYKNRSVRSPYQSSQSVPKKAQEQEHPIRSHVRKLCGTYNLSATFTEDAEALSTLQKSRLIAVRCVLSKDGKPIGIGHGSSIVSRINRASERTAFSCLNGALMSAINSACKTLDVLRLEVNDDQAATDKSAMYREYSEPATEKQKNYARQLLSMNVENEADAEQIASTLDDMTKDEISGLIQRFAA